ncbi:hypothetical protein O7599_26825 [Streptomyces sp. WMMC500]|uniref:hypothetical protein n=1 Tax=Streptomyces sp. WMMC500 TaxID=3015154 RepID=UPI00248B6DB6|nr:hypothetical protein [Streptomyces sp. WMMC500]WBB59173.1 hypothetical protein O7599_26825 [Streptomyces sp. WMMC500]
MTIALAGCGTRTSAEDMRLDEVLDATFEEADTLTSTKTLTDGTMVMRTAVVDGTVLCDMQIRMGKARTEMLVTDSAVYSRTNKVALRRAAASTEDVRPELIEMMDDRWVKRASAQFTADLARESLCDRTEQRSGLEDTFLAPKNRGDGEEQDGTLNGRPTTRITFTEGPKPVEVHVAAEGPPYLLKITERGGVVWTFSDFDKPYRTTAPANAIDEGELPEQLVAALG